MSSNKSHSTGRKSKYFYYKGRKKSDHHQCCNHCEEEQCSTECNKCNDKYRSDNEFDRYFDDADATVTQEGDQYSFMDQESAEMIWVKESCNITVDSTDTQAALSLQASLQLAITLVLNIAIGDSNRSNSVSQELMQHFNADQVNKQKIFIYNTKDATVTTTDTDLVINIQLLLQLLLALVVMVDVL
ncbi:hypothetical protein GCM10009001_21590 [Virgibacillus siamensis]|uniref:Spore coat protein X/V domain-containing protein n=1 Tax=Virgibacillus siamensis TaxID=480071 RepID=A0ABP3R6V4_9BACI